MSIARDRAALHRRESRVGRSARTRRRTHLAAAALLAAAAVGAAQETGRTEPPAPPPPVQRDPILDVIPAEALFVATARNLGGVDGKVATLLRQLDVPFPFTPSDRIYAAFGLMDGIDTIGDAALVVMPPEDRAAGGDPVVGLILPTRDFPLLIEPLEPQELEGGLFSIRFKKKPALARYVRGYAVISESRAFLQNLLKTAIRQRWSAHQLRRYDENDVSAWVDVAAIAADPKIQARLAPVLGRGQRLAALRILQDVQYSLRLDERALVTQAFARTPLRGVGAGGGPSFDGLPAEGYALAMAANVNKDLVTEFMGRLTALIESEAPKEVFPMLKIVLDVTASASADAQSVRVSINGLPGGADGLISATKLVNTRGPASAWIDRLAEGVQKLKAAFVETQDEEAIRLAQRLTFTRDAEKIGETGVHHLRVDVEGAGRVDYPRLQAVIGREGLTARLAAVDEHTVIIHLGGGRERFEQVLAGAKTSAAALAADAGVRKVARLLSEPSFLTAFLSLEGAVPIAFSVGTAMGDPPPPFKLAEVEAPIGISVVHLGEGAFEATAACPVELIVAIKNAFMEMIARSVGGPPPQGN
ncbi:MAG: hypothetical protein C4547_11085 [Phycisphaerales bacterium]|nr:MAG: hypothetical protein C4547_11085 [Phycisphaerales bacterium]